MKHTNKYKDVKANKDQLSVFNTKVEQVVRAFVLGKHAVPVTYKSVPLEVTNGNQCILSIGTYHNGFQESKLYPHVVTACVAVGVKASDILNRLEHMRDDEGNGACFLFDDRSIETELLTTLEAVYVAVEDLLGVVAIPKATQ